MQNYSLTASSCLTVNDYCSPGICSLVNNIYVCSCPTLYTSSTDCKGNFFQYYKLRDAYYYPLIWFVSIVFLFILVPEVWIDIYRPHKKYSLFLCKIFAVLHFTLRYVDSSLWAYMSITEEVDRIAIYYQISFSITQACALVCYVSIVITWLHFYILIQHLTNTKKKLLKRIKFWTSMSIVVYIPFTIIVKVLSSIGINSTVNDLLYNVVSVIYLIVLVLWSTYHIVNIIRNMKNKLNVSSDETTSFLWKNNIMGLVNAIMTVYVIIIGLYVAMVARSDPWKWLAFNTIMRIVEWLMIGLGIAIFQAHWSFRNPIKNWKEQWKRNLDPAPAKPVHISL